MTNIQLKLKQSGYRIKRNLLFSIDILTILLLHYSILVIYHFSMHKHSCTFASAEAFQYNKYHFQCLVVPVEQTVTNLKNLIGITKRP